MSQSEMEELIKLQKETIESLRQLVENQRLTIEQMAKSHEEQTAQLNQTIANLNETVAYLKRKLFASSSEKTKTDAISGQMDLFNEAEGWDRDSYVSAIKVEAHSRKRRSGSITDAVPEGRP